MKAPANGMKIRPMWDHAGRGPIVGWQVIQVQPFRVLWEGKTYEGARSAHARLSLKVSGSVARRMGNA